MFITSAISVSPRSQIQLRLNLECPRRHTDVGTSHLASQAELDPRMPQKVWKRPTLTAIPGLSFRWTEVEIGQCDTRLPKPFSMAV